MSFSFLKLLQTAMLDLFSAYHSNVLSFYSLVICCYLRNHCKTRNNYCFIYLIVNGSALRAGLSLGFLLLVLSGTTAGVGAPATVVTCLAQSHGADFQLDLSSRGLSSSRRWQPGPLHLQQCSKTRIEEDTKVSWRLSPEPMISFHHSAGQSKSQDHPWFGG